MSNKTKMELLSEQKVSGALLRLEIPTMIGMLISALYNAIGAYFVSGFGISQMGVVSVVFPIVQLVIGLGMMFGAGASSYISRLLGKENYKWIFFMPKPHLNTKRFSTDRLDLNALKKLSVR